MYHPSLKFLNTIIDKNVSILYMDNDGKNVFTPRRVVLFRSACKLNSYLFRAKLYSLDRTVGGVRV